MWRTMEKICKRPLDSCRNLSPVYRCRRPHTCGKAAGGLLLLCAVLSFVPATAADIRELTEEAYRNNQELVSLEEKVKALYTEAPYSGSLQDPVIGIGLVNVPVDSFDLDQEAMTQKQLFVSQKFPWFGTLGLKQQESELRALEADALFQAKRREVAARLAGSLYDLGFLIKSLEVNNNLQSMVTQILRIAETRYSTGEGLQQDILAGQVQLSELVDEKISLSSREKAIRAEIGAILNRPEVYADSSPEIPEEPLKLPGPEVLKRVALQFNPELAAKKTAVDVARVELELAEKAYLPDFDLRLSYGQREDNPADGSDRADFVSAVVAFSVPLYKTTRQDTKFAATEQRLTAAEKSLLGFKNTLSQNIHQLLAEIEGARQNYDLYQNALAVQAANLADASLVAYSVGKVEFNTMLSARLRLLRVELTAEKYRYQSYKKLTALEQLIGTDLDALEGMQ